MFSVLMVVSLIPFLIQQRRHRTVWMLISLLVVSIIGTTVICTQYVFNNESRKELYASKSHGFLNDWSMFRDTFLNVNANLYAAEMAKKSSNWTAAANQSEVVAGANLKYRNLRFATADRVFLEESNLDRTDWSYAHLREAQLSDSTMLDSDLVSTEFDGAVMKNVDFRGANLTNATLNNADIAGAHFEDFTGDDDANLPPRPTEISWDQLKHAKNFKQAHYNKPLQDYIKEIKEEPAPVNK
jgi:hypothetical protein